jgi:hypothetical protein
VKVYGGWNGGQNQAREVKSMARFSSFVLGFGEKGDE